MCSSNYQSSATFRWGDGMQPGPSLSGGLFPSPGRRVSGLGGPEPVTPMLLFQLRPSSFSYSEMMGWFHAALTSTCWSEICIILTQRGAAHEEMVDETKLDSICWKLKAMNLQRLPLSQYFIPTKRLFSGFFRNVPGNDKKISLIAISFYVRSFQSWIEKLGSRADQINFRPVLQGESRKNTCARVFSAWCDPSTFFQPLSYEVSRV